MNDTDIANLIEEALRAAGNWRAAASHEENAQWVAEFLDTVRLSGILDMGVPIALPPALQGIIEELTRTGAI